MQQFLWRKQGENLSKETILDYRKHITRFFKRFPDAYTSVQLKRFVLEYMAQKVKPATFNLRLVYLKTFLKWCVKEGIFSENPLDGILKKKDEGRVVKLEAETLQKLLSLPDKKPMRG